MKKVLLLALGVWISQGIYAQGSHDLKGPRAKNASVFERMNHTPVVTRSKPLALKGPAAKNHIRRGIDQGEGFTPVTRSARMWLKGPGAKNYQPRIRKSNTDIFRNSSRR
jgi:hypothetical protein